MDIEVLSAGVARDAAFATGGVAPFSVSWKPVQVTGVCLWLGIGSLDAGLGMGYVEVRIAPMSGEVVGLSVVKMPRLASAELPVNLDELPPPSFPTANVDFGIRIDRSAWELSQRGIPQRAVVLVERTIEQYRPRRGVYLSLSDERPEKKFSHGRLEFVLDKRNNFAGIVIPVDLLSDK